MTIVIRAFARAAFAAPFLLSSTLFSSDHAHATLEKAKAKANSTHQAVIPIGHGDDSKKRRNEIPTVGQGHHDLRNPARLLIISAGEGHGEHVSHGSGETKPAMENGVNAGSARIGDIVVEGAWTRQAPPSSKVLGGYASITNTGTASDRLVAAKAAFSKRVEVHEMKMDNGVMKMNAVAGGLEIKPGETVELKLGSFHLMFMEATSPKAGETVPVTLVFDTAGVVVVHMPVAAIGAGKAPAMGHGDMGPGEMGPGNTGRGKMNHGAKHGG